MRFLGLNVRHSDLTRRPFPGHDRRPTGAVHYRPTRAAILDREQGFQRMTTQDQSATEAFLSERARSGSAAHAEIVTTHISKVFVGEHAVFKLKRAVRFPYLDFSTPAARVSACERELKLNRRTAPTLYRGVRCVVRTAEGAPAFDGEGLMVDAVVEMSRFEQADLFDSLALRGALTAPMIADLAQRIARFHAHAEVSTRHGGVPGMAAGAATH